MTRRQFLRRSVLTLGAAGLGASAYARFGELHWVELVHRPLFLRDLPPELEGARLVQLSDLHVGPKVDSEYLIETFRSVAALKPDILALTGDFVSYQAPQQFKELDRVLDHLPHGRMATLACLGNHDSGFGWSHPEVADQVAAVLVDRGVRLLRNETETVGRLRIVGLEDFWTPTFDPAPVLRSLVGFEPLLVLSHNPDAVDLPVWHGIRGFILAGHTHGGQCRPPFLPPPILPVRNKKYTAGEFNLGDGRRLYINRGLGHLLPVRFNVRPEVTVFSLTGSLP